MDFNIKDSSKLVTEDEIKRTGGLVYDPEAGVDREAPVNLPNVDEMLDSIEKILEHMCTDDMMTLKETDGAEYEKQMEKQFPEFSSKYYSLFQMILSGADISYLFTMLGYMDQVNKGEANFEDVQKQFGADLQADFVYQTDDIKTGEDADFDDSWIDDNNKDQGNQSEKKKKKRKRKR